MTGQPGEHLRRPPPAWDLLQDKILVHTRASTKDGKIPAQAGRAHDGIVLCGADALPTAGTFHQAASRSLQLVDPQGYKNEASSDAPFQLDSYIRSDQPTLFDDEEDEDKNVALQHSQQVQLHNGTAASLTPTRYIKAGDRRTVTAVVSSAAALDPERTILTMPLDHRWLREDDDINFLMETLSALPHIKAVALGATHNPLKTRGTATRLRTLISGLERVALIRTDLAGLDAYAHGALFASIGMQTALRHIRPPGSRAPRRRKGHNVTTTVLHPDLMDYFNADTLRDLYGDMPAPSCHCAECQGRSLLRFEHIRSDQEEANRHNIATWLPWAQELQRTAPGQPRRLAWHEFCWNAIQAHQALREELAAPGALEPPYWLREWVGEPD